VIALSISNGIFVAMVTPFIGETINRDAIARLLEFYKTKRLHGVLVCGSTGEAHLMSKEEIKETIEIVVNFTPGNLKVIAGIVRSSTTEAMEIAKFSEDVGADAILALTPYYYSYKERGIIEHYKSIRKSVDISLLLYNAPLFTGYNIKPELVAKMLNEGIIDGIKDTTTSLDHLSHILLENERKDAAIFVGTSLVFLPALAVGVSGGILASANYAPEVVLEVYENWISGKLKGAHESFAKLIALSKAVEVYGIPGIKAAMDIRGLPVGNPRSPLVELENDEKRLIRKHLEKIAGITY